MAVRKVDHLLMPGCPEVENSYQDPFPSLSVFQYSVLIINGCGLEMGVVSLQKKRIPLFPALDPPLLPTFASPKGYKSSLVDSCKSSSVLSVSPLVAFMF